MEYPVPKIEYETKIFGPFTLRQGIIFGIGLFAIFFLKLALPEGLFLISFIVIALLCSALAFLKINGEPLTNVIYNFFNFLISKKIYVWEKENLPPLKLKSQKEGTISILKKAVEFGRKKHEGK